MSKVRKNAATGGGGQPGVSPVLQGGDVGSSDVRVGFMGTVRRKNEGGGGKPLGVPTSDHSK